MKCYLEYWEDCGRWRRVFPSPLQRSLFGISFSEINKICTIHAVPFCKGKYKFERGEGGNEGGTLLVTQPGIFGRAAVTLRPSSQASSEPQWWWASGLHACLRVRVQSVGPASGFFWVPGWSPTRFLLPCEQRWPQTCGRCLLYLTAMQLRGKEASQGARAGHRNREWLGSENRQMSPGLPVKLLGENCTPQGATCFWQGSPCVLSLFCGF